MLCFVFWCFCDFSEGHKNSLLVVSDPIGHPVRLMMPRAGGQGDTGFSSVASVCSCGQGWNVQDFTVSPFKVG